MSTKPDDVVCDGDVCRKMTPEEVAARAQVETSGAAPKVLQLLGSALVGKDGSDVPVSSITGPGKVIGLYFSAHWCPPCRHFTPHLAGIYNKFKASHARAADWEVVFVSSDRDEAAWAEYFAEMPWLALPFAARDAKNELSKLFKVRGIPSLVLVDGETGELITANGRDALGEDEECEGFPWKPKTLEQILDGAKLVEPGADASAAAVDALPRLRGRTVLLYFSASWCPPCRRFTPKLAEALAALRERGEAVEAVFVSSDREADKWREYHGHMTWPALPFEDRKRAAELSSFFEVEGIPTLVVLDENLKVITSEGVEALGSDPTLAAFPWRPQPLEQLNGRTVGCLNTSRTLLLLLDEADEASAEEKARAALGGVATATKAGPSAADWSFLWAQRSDALAKRVLAFAGLGPEKEGEEEEEGKAAPAAAAGGAGHAVVLLDVPSQRVWELTGKAEVTAAGMERVVADAAAGRLGPGKALGQDDE